MLASSCARAAASRTLVLLCSAVPQSPPPALGRRALLHGAAAAVAAPALTVFPTVAAADASDVVVVGQVKYDVKLPPGATATITGRVVGRNSNGPLVTFVIPDLGATPSPVDFVITRADMREVADFVWLDQDLFLKADVVVNGKTVLVGRGKAKAVEGGEGAPLASRHSKPLLEVKP